MECIYCRRKLDNLNDKNIDRHVEACRKKSPYPKSNPKKQSKLGFKPVLPPPPVQVQEIDFVTDAATATTAFGTFCLSFGFTILSTVRLLLSHKERRATTCSIHTILRFDY